MSRPEADGDPLTARVTALEELFTHLQRTVQELDQVVIGLQKRLDAVDFEFQRLADVVARRIDEPEPPFDPASERPPHY